MCPGNDSLWKNTAGGKHTMHIPSRVNLILNSHPFYCNHYDLGIKTKVASEKDI